MRDAPGTGSMTDTDQRKASQSADTEIAYDSGFLAGKRSQAAEIARLNDEVERLTGLLEQERVLTLADIRHDAEQAERHRAVERLLELARAYRLAAEESEDDGEDDATLDAGNAFWKHLASLDQASPAQSRGEGAE